MSVTVTIRPEDLGLAQGIHGGTRNAAIHAAGTQLKEEVLRRGIVPFRTGALFDSMSVTTSSEGVTVKFTAPHAEAVEFGARPHVIAAKNWPTLVFRSGGQWRRPKQVFHPGFGGRGYALKVADVLADLIVSEFIARLSRGLLR